MFNLTSLISLLLLCVALASLWWWRQQQRHLAQTLMQAQQQRHQAEQEVAVLNERLQGLRMQFETREQDWQSRNNQYVQQIGELEQRLANTQAQWQQLQQAHQLLSHDYEQQQAQLAQEQARLQSAQLNLTQTFENVANRLFAEKQQQFQQHSEKGLSQLLAPLRQQLDSFQQRVNQVHQEASQGQAAIQTQLAMMQQAGQAISAEAKQLSQALKGNKKVLGNWGEMQLEAALQSVGLVRDHNYQVQASTRTDTGKTLIPDVVLLLPDRKKIVVDSKVSLNAYQCAIHEVDEALAQQYWQQHIKDVRQHVQDLANKDYSQAVGEGALGFVFMFMPIEAAYVAALQHDPQLFQDAYNKGVILVSQTTLMPTLRTVANLWVMAGSNALAQEIGQKAGDIYKQLVVVAEHLHKLGNGLHSVTQHYNRVVTSFAGNQGLINKADKFKMLSTKVQKDVPALSLVEETPQLERLAVVVSDPQSHIQA